MNLPLNGHKIFKQHKDPLIPTIDNLIFYNEIDIFPGEIFENKISAIKNIIKDTHKYQLFLKHKARRPNYDIYACFQPFNEALKALYPFLKKLQQQVKSGDVILNLWDRTGWLTSLLSGLFPEQQIITTWEGNKDVLGYKGFYFWMRNAKNVNILFCDLNVPLPIEDKSISFVVGLDAFHRFNQFTLLKELTRVVKEEGAIIFPHVHLSNSEPIPFFERGGKQHHGKDYDLAFKHLTANTNWKGYIFSEPDLFKANDINRNDSIPLLSIPNTTDYNALLALLPKTWDHKTLTAFNLNDIVPIDTAYVLVNSLLNINLNLQHVAIDLNYLNGAVGSLLKRHPVYLERIKALDQYELSSLASKIIYLANKGYTVRELCTNLKVELNFVLKELTVLEQIGLIQVLPISFDGFRLQHHLMSQQYIVPKDQQNLKVLWQNTVSLFPDNIALVSLIDGSEFTYKDGDEIIKNILVTFSKNDLKKGDKIIICAPIHSESILLFWACMQAGIVVVPLAIHLSAIAFSYIVDQTEPVLCFTNQRIFIENKYNFKNIPTIIFDETDEITDGIYFADWLQATDDDSITEVDISSTDQAVILFTSGSTGQPKGVQLCQGNLFRSGSLITETFLWEKEDRFIAIGGLDSMSGLRNATIAPAHVGSTVIVPTEMLVGNLFAIAETIAENKVTILGCNPAMLHQLVKHKPKIGNQLNTVKTLMCTGNYLSNSLREAFKNNYNLDILNYYGLTETTGICIAQSNLNNQTSFDNIGKPIECIAQIVNEQGIVLKNGEVGELRIYSDNLMMGYYKDKLQTDLAIRDGWFYTQDLAKFTADGFIELIGRKRDIVKTSTEELIYLQEVKHFINTLPNVEDCFVSSFKHEGAEKIAAFIILKNQQSLTDRESIINIKNLIAASLGENKVPNKIKIISELPYNDHGKLLINQLINDLY